MTITNKTGYAQYIEELTNAAESLSGHFERASNTKTNYIDTNVAILEKEKVQLRHEINKIQKC